MKSQSIDVHDLSRSVQLPPLQSPVENPRPKLKETLPKYVRQVQSVTKPLQMHNRLNKSVEFSKHSGPHFNKHRIESEIRQMQMVGDRQDHNIAQALSLQMNKYRKDELDGQIFRKDQFKNAIDTINERHNSLLKDFNQFHDAKTDLERSPFVPSAVAKARRAKDKQQRENLELEQMKEKWLVTSASIASSDQENEAAIRTNELLAYSVSDDAQVKDYSLENRISVGDLANVGDLQSDSKLSKLPHDISQIDEKRLDVELQHIKISNESRDHSQANVSFKLAEISKAQTERKIEPQVAESEREFDLKLDERYIQANQALKAGDISKYEQL